MRLEANIIMRLLDQHKVGWNSNDSYLCLQGSLHIDHHWSAELIFVDFCIPWLRISECRVNAFVFLCGLKLADRLSWCFLLRTSSTSQCSSWKMNWPWRERQDAPGKWKPDADDVNWCDMMDSSKESMLSSAVLIVHDSSPIVSRESRRFHAQEFNWLPPKYEALIFNSRSVAWVSEAWSPGYLKCWWLCLFTVIYCH